MFYIDPLYIIFSLPAIFIGGLASLLLRYWTNKYLSRENLNHITGVEVVERIARKKGLDIRLTVNDNFLSDHYNPSDRTLSLSRPIAQTTTITAVGIAAHEMGHALQHHNGNILLSLRNLLVPALNIGTSLGYFLLIMGIIIGFTQLAWVGIILFSGSTIFSFMTLPIELDASSKALKLIREEQLLFPEEISGAKKVLTAAALTYVAASLQSLGSLVYFFLRVRGMGRRD